MTYQETIDLLDRVDLNAMYPMVIPSVLRPGYHTYKGIVSKLPQQLKDRVHFVVREDQLEQYKAAQPDSKFLVIPQEELFEGFGLDSTRAWYHKKMLEAGHSKILEFDDDITSVSMAYQVPETHTTRRFVAADRDKYQGHILALACTVANWWFRENARACVGAFCRIRPQTCKWDYGDLLIVTRQMGVVQGFMLTNLVRCHDKGIFHTGEFDTQAEDIAFNCNVLDHGGEVFKMPAFLANMVYEEVNPRTEPVMQKCRGDEKVITNDAYQKLTAKYGDYFRVIHTFEDGSPKYFGFMWQRYNKAHGLKPGAVLWRDYLGG